LSDWAGQTVRLTLATDPGPEGDGAGDWAGWGDVRVVTGETEAVPWAWVRTAWEEAGVTAEDLIAVGEVARKAERYEEALTWYERTIALQPESGNPWYYKGLLYEQSERWHNAVEMYREAIRLCPQRTDPYYALGNIFLHKYKDSERALKVYNDILKLDPLPVMAYVGKGVALEQLGHLEQAEMAYETAVQMSYEVSSSADYTTECRKCIWPHYVLGEFYFDQGRLQDAENSAKEAISLDTQKRWVEYPLWLLGRIALSDKHHEEAMGYFSQSLNYASKSYIRSQSLLGIARIYIDQGDIEHGLSYLRRAHLADSQNRGLHRFFADMLLESGYYEEAIRSYERYLEKWCGDQEIQSALQTARESLSGN
jgi:tetratricopeptide (TPR) repeat protein